MVWMFVGKYNNKTVWIKSNDLNKLMNSLPMDYIEVESDTGDPMLIQKAKISWTSVSSYYLD